MSQALPERADLEHLRKLKVGASMAWLSWTSTAANAQLPMAYGVTAVWRTPHVLETIATKDGEVVGRGRYDVLPDGRTMTITALEQLLVLVRE